MSDSTISAGKKEDGYDPTTVPLPPDAVRAAPGERQIAYPYVDLAMSTDRLDLHLPLQTSIPSSKDQRDAGWVDFGSHWSSTASARSTCSKTQRYGFERTSISGNGRDAERRERESEC
jgi:hypothetical protein